MLSKEAEQFILELRMYLMSKGKNEQEIEEVILELEDHLLQAEAEGRNIKDITGDSPREYMKSISREMSFDKREFLTLAPMTVLLISAFLVFTPALREDFSLSKISVWGIIIVTILSIFLYGFLIVRVLPKFFNSKWFYVIALATFLVVTGFFVIVEWLDNDPFFVATPLQNKLLVIGCIVIFVAWAIYAKTWMTIIVPFFLSWGPMAERFIPDHINEDPFYIALTVMIFTLIAIIGGILFFLYRKNKKNKTINQ